MRSILLLFVTLAAAAAPARADGALDEVSAGSQPQTATTPKSNWLADKVAAIWEPGERWQLRVDFTATRDFGVRPTAMPTASDTTDIYLVNATAEFDPDEQFSIKLVGGYSPQSTMFSGTTVPFTTRTGMSIDANAALQSTSGSYSGGVMFGFDSGTKRDVETALTLFVNATEYDTQQQIVALQDKAGANVDVQQLRDYCATTKCPTQLTATLTGGDAQLAQVAIEATASLTFKRTVDLGVDATYYAYDRDPTQVGYFSLATVGRATSFGNGMGIAPYDYTVAPDVVVRLGGFMAMASVSYGKYVGDEGWDVTGALRMQYKLKLAHGKRVKLWARVVASRDVDQTSAVSTSGSAALGVQYTW